ncbi:MAG: hypothetical protein R2852_04385 [Bacteroidia bacterium]
MIAIVWLLIIGLVLFVLTANFFTAPKSITKEDIYGEYVIDRDKYPGYQADWQYNHFRFEITKDNAFVFHETDKDKITKTYTGTVSFRESNVAPRITLHVDLPRNHIIENEPTLYRKAFSFYYVFKSPKFGNVFFTKGKWKPFEY